jgi:predicted phosphodiesterase
MFCVTVDRPTDWPLARIYILSDLHIGDANCDIHSIFERVETIKNDPYGLVVINGDLFNNATREGVSDIYSETLSPMDAIKRAVEMLFPIRDKIIAVDIGNHEARTYKKDGIDIMRLACRELGCEPYYNPEGVFIFLRFGRRPKHECPSGRDEIPWTYTIYATHGSGGGRKEGAKILRLADLASIVDADMYIHSHTHLALAFKQVFNRTNLQRQQVVPTERLFVNDCSALEYGGYSQANGYKPTSLSSPVSTLYGDCKKLKAEL